VKEDMGQQGGKF